MKKSFMTRVLATGLSVAMAFSLSTATNLVSAQAASKPVLVDYTTGGSGKTMTVNVGTTAKIKVNAATKKNYKIASVKKSSGKIKTAVNKAGTVVTVRGLVATEENKPAAIKVSFTSKKTKKTSKYTFASKVTVVGEKEPEVTQAITSVTQKSFTTLEVVFQTALEKIDGTFTITRVSDNQDIQVKSSVLDATDKTKVTLATYLSLTDGKEYVVKYAANDEAKTVYEGKVTVTDGTVAAVNITPSEVTVDVATEIKYQTLDANGLVVSEKNIKKAASDVDVSWKSDLGTVDDATGKLTLYNVGDTATFTVTYHTGKYDQTTGAETLITKDFTVTCVKDATVVSQYTYSAEKEQPFLWSKVTPKNKIALSDGIETEQRTAYFLIKDAKGNDVTNTCGYTVVSSDNSIVIADGDVKDGAPLVPVSKGTAYLMIKDTDDKTVATLPITVGDKRKLTTLKLSASSVSVASTAAVGNPWECAYTDVIAKDQYLEDIGVNIDTSEMYTESHATDLTALATNGKTLRIYGETTTPSQAKKATDAYKIVATDYAGNTMTTKLNASTVQVSGTKTLSVVFLDVTDDNKVVTSIDSSVSESKNWNSKYKQLDPIVVEKQSGVVIGVPTNTTYKISSVKVTKNDGSVLAYTNSGSSFKANKIASCAAINKEVMATVATNASLAEACSAMAISVTTKSAATYYGAGNGSGSLTGPEYGSYTKLLAPGTYTVRFVISGAKYDATGSFTVTDWNTPVSASVYETNLGSDVNLKTFFNNKDNVAFFYGDRWIGTPTSLGSSSTTVPECKAIDYSINSNGKNVYVKSVVVEVKSANNENQTYYVKVPVNKTFTTSDKFTPANIWQP